MLQSPSWEANWFEASQEIPRISRNPKVYYRTHKRSSPVSILGQPNPYHIPTSHLVKIHPNIIHPSKPRSLQWSPFLRFPHQDPMHPLSSSVLATCPANLIRAKNTLINITLFHQVGISRYFMRKMHGQTTLKFLEYFWKVICVI